MNFEIFNTLAFIFLLLFCLIGIFDGTYFHFYKYKLYKFEETKAEHRVHGLRSFIFVPISLIFFVFNSQGALLYLGLILVTIDLALEVYDVLLEKESRKNLGGICPQESLCHIMATTCRFLALSFVLSAKGVDAFGLDAAMLGKDLSENLTYLGTVFSVSCFIGGALHFINFDFLKVLGFVKERTLKKI